MNTGGFLLNDELRMKTIIFEQFFIYQLQLTTILICVNLCILSG